MSWLANLFPKHTFLGKLLGSTNKSRGIEFLNFLNPTKVLSEIGHIPENIGDYVNSLSSKDQKVEDFKYAPPPNTPAGSMPLPSLSTNPLTPSTGNVSDLLSGITTTNTTTNTPTNNSLTSVGFLKDVLNDVPYHNVTTKSTSTDVPQTTKEEKSYFTIAVLTLVTYFIFKKLKL